MMFNKVFKFGSFSLIALFSCVGGVFASGVLSFDQTQGFIIQDKVRVVNPKNFDLQVSTLANNYNGTLFFDAKQDFQLRIDADCTANPPLTPPTSCGGSENNLIIKSKKNGVEQIFATLTETGVFKVGVTQADPNFTLESTGDTKIKGNIKFLSPGILAGTSTPQAGHFVKDTNNNLTINSIGNLTFTTAADSLVFDSISQLQSLTVSPGSANAFVTPRSTGTDFITVNDVFKIYGETTASTSTIDMGTNTLSLSAPSLYLQNGTATQIINFDTANLKVNGSKVMASESFGGMYTLQHCTGTGGVLPGLPGICGWTNTNDYGDRRNACKSGNPYSGGRIDNRIRDLWDFFGNDPDYAYLLDNFGPSTANVERYIKYYEGTDTNLTCGCPADIPNEKMLYYIAPAGSDQAGTHEYTEVFWCSK